MSKILRPFSFGEAEYTEKRSRFIGRLWPCSSEAEAIELIAKMREQHWDAAHNVYAYVIREGGAMRFSDDGEPQGSSGTPVLDVFRKAGITDFCCVVTRYFGGILLGAGGLVRAYSKAASLALEAAGIAELLPVIRVAVSCSYNLYERMRREMELYGSVGDVKYGESVEISGEIRSEMLDELQKRLAELSSGGVALRELETGLLPVKI